MADTDLNSLPNNTTKHTKTATCTPLSPADRYFLFFIAITVITAPAITASAAITYDTAELPNATDMSPLIP